MSTWTCLMVYKFLIKTLLVLTLQVMLLPNQELAEELNKPLMRKVEKV